MLFLDNTLVGVSIVGSNWSGHVLRAARTAVDLDVQRLRVDPLAPVAIASVINFCTATSDWSTWLTQHRDTPKPAQHPGSVDPGLATLRMAGDRRVLVGTGTMHLMQPPGHLQPGLVEPYHRRLG